MFDLQSALQSALQLANCSADSDQTIMYMPVYHTNGLSIKNTFGMVINCLVGMGLNMLIRITLLFGLKLLNDDPANIPNKKTKVDVSHT